MSELSDAQLAALTGKLDDVVRELSTIKRLVAVALIKNGLSQQVLADALGVNQSTVSRMILGDSKKRPAR